MFSVGLAAFSNKSAFKPKAKANTFDNSEDFLAKNTVSESQLEFPVEASCREPAERAVTVTFHSSPPSPRLPGTSLSQAIAA